MFRILTEEEIKKSLEEIEEWWKNLPQIYKNFIHDSFLEFKRLSEMGEK